MRKIIKIPYILKIIFSNYGRGQVIISIRILCFSFCIALLSGLGWSFTPRIDKWDINVRIHLNRVFIVLVIGISQSSILNWQIERGLKRMSPEKLKEFKKMLNSILKEVKDNE